MESMFYIATLFNNGDITNAATKPLTRTASSTWDTGNVTTMYQMFYYASAFNQDVSSWDTAKVKNMYNMFAGATLFNNGDITNAGGKALTWLGTGNIWKTGEVTTMFQMFYNASAFNQDVSSWDTA